MGLICEKCQHRANQADCYGCDTLRLQCCQCHSTLRFVFESIPFTRPLSRASSICSQASSIASVNSGTSVPPNSRKTWPKDVLANFGQEDRRDSSKDNILRYLSDLGCSPAAYTQSLKDVFPNQDVQVVQQNCLNAGSSTADFRKGSPLVGIGQPLLHKQRTSISPNKMTLGEDDIYDSGVQLDPKNFLFEDPSTNIVPASPFKPPLLAAVSTDNSEATVKPSAATRTMQSVDTSPGSWTYSCTYHGCTLRFVTRTKLQQHKREGHRLSATALLESRSSQAGYHRCERINPSTGKPCNSVFSRPFDLTRHEDTIHNARKQKVQCHLCVEKKTFSRNDALTRHMRVVHPDVDWGDKRRRRAPVD